MKKEYKGYGGGKVTIDGDSINIKLMFMKEDCKLGDVSNVVFQEPSGLKNGCIKIVTQKGSYDVLFLKKDVELFRELHEVLSGSSRGDSKNFNATKKVGKLLEIDEGSKKWILVQNHRIYDFDDIVDFELLEDGESIVKGGLGRAIVGGALLGGVGAVVGGVTGRKKSKSICNSMSIKIVLNDMKNPNAYIKLIESPAKKDGFVYRTMFNAAQECLSVLELMCNSQKENISNNEEPSNQEVDYDSLRKLSCLLTDGIITQEEFDAKKKQMLGL